MYRRFTPVAKKRKEKKAKWNKPTMKMLLREYTSTINQKEKELIKKKIESVKTYCKINNETITYYPNRTNLVCNLV